MCSTILLEIACFTLVRGGFYYITRDKIENTRTADVIWSHMLKWLQNTQTYKIPLKYLTSSQIEQLQMIGGDSNTSQQKPKIDVNNVGNKVLHINHATDLKIRLCCLNRTFINKLSNPSVTKQFVQYLLDNESTFYCKTTFKGMRNIAMHQSTSTDKKKRNGQFTLFGEFFKFYTYQYKDNKEEFAKFKASNATRIANKTLDYYSEKKYNRLRLTNRITFDMTFIFMPLYLFSKLVNILFPILCLLYAFVLNENAWHNIDIFQWIMLIIYLVLFFLWVIFFSIAFKEEFLMLHMFGTGYSLSGWYPMYAFHWFTFEGIQGKDKEKESETKIKSKLSNNDNSNGIVGINIDIHGGAGHGEDLELHVHTLKKEYYFLPLSAIQYYNELMSRPFEHGAVFSLFPHDIGVIIIDYLCQLQLQSNINSFTKENEWQYDESKIGYARSQIHPASKHLSGYSSLRKRNYAGLKSFQIIDDYLHVSPKEIQNQPEKIINIIKRDGKNLSRDLICCHARKINVTQVLKDDGKEAETMKRILDGKIDEQHFVDRLVAT